MYDNIFQKFYKNTSVASIERWQKVIECIEGGLFYWYDLLMTADCGIENFVSPYKGHKLMDITMKCVSKEINSLQSKFKKMFVKIGFSTEHADKVVEDMFDYIRDSCEFEFYNYYDYDRIGIKFTEEGVKCSRDWCSKVKKIGGYVRENSKEAFNLMKEIVNFKK